MMWSSGRRPAAGRVSRVHDPRPGAGRGRSRPVRPRRAAETRV